jgi:hypothetical protein
VTLNQKDPMTMTAMTPSVGLPGINRPAPDFTAQTTEINRIECKAMAWHDLRLHTALCAQPRHLPAARTHGVRDRKARKNMPARTRCHDHEVFHARLPLMRILFS